MSASTSRTGAALAARASRARIPISRMAASRPVQPTGDFTLRYASSQPKIGARKVEKGKESDRYNYNTSMSFSEDIDPDVRLFGSSPCNSPEADWMSARQLSSGHCS